jgi:kumamolisin
MATTSVSGSERSAMPGATRLSACHSAERFEVSVLVRARAQSEFAARVAALGAGPDGACLTRAEFAQRHGAAAADLEAVRAFAASHGLAVVQEHAARRTVVLSGSAQHFCAAFGVELGNWRHAGGTYRGRTGAVRVPAQLKDIIVAVLGLDNRPQAQPHFRLRSTPGNVSWRPALASAVSFTPIELAALYEFPEGAGAGECVAIIELGGGYRPEDLDTYFKGLKVDAPAVLAVSVDHGRNAPTGDASGPDGEVMLDVEVVGTLAPQAKIAVYFAPNTDAGFLDAITTAIHDSDNKPSVISISWGGPESSWTQQAMTAMDKAFQEAAAMGITVCAASGDNGSADGVTDGADHVDFPASSPYALACGGTSVRVSGARIGSETVWNNGSGNGATGGGISSFFAVPDYQRGLKVAQGGAAQALAMRGVPDVAGDADPQTGYDVRIDGSDTVIGGTSAVAPLWAALVARLNATAGKPLGFLNTQLYRQPQALRDIVDGSNGSFRAAAGWDACTGLGSPNGVELARVLKPAAT